jgi:hypothetical protein
MHCMHRPWQEVTVAQITVELSEQLCEAGGGCPPGAHTYMCVLTTCMRFHRLGPASPVALRYR